jgi:hypothetical protein
MKLHITAGNYSAPGVRKKPEIIIMHPSVPAIYGKLFRKK